jgi:2'-hydroxyisoflavone reductase
MPLEIKVEHLYGNRDPNLPADEEHPDGSPKGLEQLAGRSWDVAIDNSGYFPRMVDASARLLAPNVAHYIYISSISAYDEASIPARGGDETVKLATLADPKVETMGAEFQNYGGLKALCEAAAAAAFPNRAAIVRPGYIVGPGDPTDRFTYWPMRIAAGGDVIAPGAAGDPLQWIDVRDLADWTVRALEDDARGVYNATGPQHGAPTGWPALLETCIEAARRRGAPPAQIVRVGETFLRAQGVAPWNELPLWVPSTDRDHRGFARVDCRRAVAAGLVTRPLAETVEAVLDEAPQLGADDPRLRSKLARAREAELIAAWRTHVARSGAHARSEGAVTP